MDAIGCSVSRRDTDDGTDSGAQIHTLMVQLVSGVALLVYSYASTLVYYVYGSVDVAYTAVGPPSGVAHT